MYDASTGASAEMLAASVLAEEPPIRIAFSVRARQVLRAAALKVLERVPVYVPETRGGFLFLS
jgi:hypothetical protein